jgi:hypothetical protein
MSMRPSIFSYARSLGSLSYVRIWHDNSGTGNTASWFLKYIIIRDLQTSVNYQFISQRWFAVEKDDGMVCSRQGYQHTHTLMDFFCF